jgi:hypothetical protein
MAPSQLEQDDEAMEDDRLQYGHEAASNDADEL